MQKRKIEDSAIWEAYNRIIAGESLTAVAKDIGLNRGTLRKYIEEVVEPNLNEIEKNRFDLIINKNFRGNSTEHKRENRNGIRKRAAEQIENSDAIRKLANYEVTPEQIEDLYSKLRTNPRTSYAKDTYIYKYLEHLTALTEFGFTSQEASDIFIRRPKLFTESANKIRKILYELVQECGSEQAAKQKLIQDPWADLRNKKTNSDEEEAEVSNGGGER